MTKEELKAHCERQIKMCEMGAYGRGEEPGGKVYEEHKLILELLEQESCDDAISRQVAIDAFERFIHELGIEDEPYNYGEMALSSRNVPSVALQPKMQQCKDCRYFEYDSVAKVDGIPLIVAHEICSRWGNGCKTKEDGYCYMFEPKKEV